MKGYAKRILQAEENDPKWKLKNAKNKDPQKGEASRLSHGPQPGGSTSFAVDRIQGWTERINNTLRRAQKGLRCFQGLGSDSGGQRDTNISEEIFSEGNF